MKRRKGTPLSLYYLSVTGLLGSCYGYRDSRLSVLLTIAHKGSIQLWATMQISRSLVFLPHSLFLSAFPPVCICPHLSLCCTSFPFASRLHFLCQYNFTQSHPAIPFQTPPPSPQCFYPSPLPLYLSIHSHHLPYLHHQRREIILPQTVKCYFQNPANPVQAARHKRECKWISNLLLTLQKSWNNHIMYT